MLEIVWVTTHTYIFDFLTAHLKKLLNHIIHRYLYSHEKIYNR